MSQLTITGKVHFQKGKKGRKRLTEGEDRENPKGRLPRVTKLMALAIRFEQLIRDGNVADYAELARLGQVSRARMTQIMNLLNLSPAIQEAILFLPRVEQGGDPVTERELRDVVGVEDWVEQQRLWS